MIQGSGIGQKTANELRRQRVAWLKLWVPIWALLLACDIAIVRVIGPTSAICLACVEIFLVVWFADRIMGRPSY